MIVGVTGPRTQDRSIVGLDLARFAAALLVAWFHLAFWSWADPGGSTAKYSGSPFRFDAIADWSWFGWVGVEIFFVISGFVIAMSAQGKTAGAFLRGRVLRLYPAVWICAPLTFVVLLALAPAGTAATPATLARSLGLWLLGPWVSATYWTLGVEMVFYALVLLAIRVKFDLERLIWLLSIPTLVCFGFAASAKLGLIAPTIGTALIGDRWAQLLLFPYGAQFALGGMLFIVANQGADRRRIAGLALFGLLGAFEVYANANVRARVVPGGASSLLPVAIWVAAAALIFASAVWNTHFRRWVGGAVPLVRSAGLATFPLYLLHNEIGAIGLRLAAALPGWAALSIAFATILALSFLVIRLEGPLRTLLARRLAALGRAGRGGSRP